MRTVRLRTNARTPRRSTSSRAKKPAMTKNAVIRNMWMTKNMTASGTLVDRSSSGEASKPGRYDIAACRTTPQSSANPRSASSA